jgi:pilus assembly protein CpaC
VGSSIARVSLTVPDVADAMVTSPQQLLIHGKQPGTISLFVWDHAGGIKKYEVNVRRDLSELAAQMKQLFPGEPITIAGSGKDVVISGTVSSKYVVDKAAEVAGGYVEKKENVVNLLKQQEGLASNQVMLGVRFAEVSRSALQEVGASFVANGYKSDWYGRATTQQYAAPDFDSDRGNGLTFSDFLNVFLFNTKHNVGTVIRALQTKGLFQSLAEPNLIALNGKEASFLAGGEYPYPVAQPSGSGTSITIQFKEFGVRLNFTPTVLANDLINLKVRPEVSSLDFSNAITLDGFRIPALSTRRTETEIELQNGQTFAIAGLLNNTVNSTMSKIPGIGDIPILGWLFRSRAYQKNQTELVVMITPQIVRRGSTGVSEGLPSPVEPWLGAPSKRLPAPAPYVGSPRYPATEAGSGGDDAPAPAPAADAAAPAAAPAQSSMPSAPAPVQPAPSKPAPQSMQMSAAKPASPKPAMAPSKPPSVAVPAPSNSDAGSSVMAVADAATPAPAMSTASAPAPAATPVTRPMSKEETKAVEEARAREREAAAKAAEKAEKERVEREKREAEERRIAEEKAEKERKIAEAKAEKERKIAEEKAAKERERQEKIDKERAKKQAELDKKNAEIARRRAAEQEKREKALAEAAARLREAQAAYQAQLKAASKGGTNDQQTKK